MDQREAEVQAVGDGGGALSAAGVGGDDDCVGDVQVIADPFQRAGFCVQVVDGDVEEALDLAGVQVHGYHVVAAGGLEHVGH